MKEIKKAVQLLSYAMDLLGGVQVQCEGSCTMRPPGANIRYVSLNIRPGTSNIFHRLIVQYSPSIVQYSPCIVHKFARVSFIIDCNIVQSSLYIVVFKNVSFIDLHVSFINRHVSFSIPSVSPNIRHVSFKICHIIFAKYRSVFSTYH